MKAPPIPPGEAQRLRTLLSLSVLDTPGAEQFDQITRVAQRVLKVPIALVSLVDADRQWFKSCQGIEAIETSREISFCGHAILAPQILVVEDATLDERFHDNPLVLDAPHIRFYAGYPLMAPNGHRIGTLCIIDRTPRRMSAADLELLTDLGLLAEQQIRSLSMATSDELTALTNRRGFYALAKQTLASAKRAQLPTTLVAIDLDDFKGLNDRHGHDAGDRALVEFARCLQLSCREADVLGRLGGDEFGALLWNADAAGAAKVIDRLGREVAAANAAAADRLPIAFSVGMTVCEGATTHAVESILAEADQRMFLDKTRRKQVKEMRAVYAMA